ncbi:hypothetical protein LTR85_002515 [Meristemomyces frigidus]|nr:hypothetical protein LTR85_002515 [Meristemomyces frigidus]
MASQRNLTSSQAEMTETLQSCLQEIRDSDPDDGRNYILDVVSMVSECLSAKEQLSGAEMTAAFATTVFGSGETALRIAGERLLHLSGGPPVPQDVAALNDFRSFATEPVLDDNDVYKTTRRQNLRASVHELFATPTQGDVKQECLTSAGQVLMLAGGCMKATKDHFSDGEVDVEEKEWREELLSYAVLAILGLAQSLSHTYGGRQVEVWDQVICGTAVGGDPSVKHTSAPPEGSSGDE